jgi:hypothetical protein
MTPPVTPLPASCPLCTSVVCVRHDTAAFLYLILGHVFFPCVRHNTAACRLRRDRGKGHTVCFQAQVWLQTGRGMDSHTLAIPYPYALVYGFHTDF